jgi:hypothetical protein
LANRFESYADIENLVQMHHNKRSSLSSSDANFNTGTSDAVSTNETNSTDGAVSGIMV